MLKTNKIPPDIKEYISYNPHTGHMEWIKKPSSKTCIGDKAGSVSYYGYIDIGFRGKLFRGHRIAWYLYYGKDPENQIDHINGIRDDNRICNLRDVTLRENHHNLKKHREGNLLGASYYARYDKWQSSIYLNGKSIHLGNFNTKQEAHSAYVNKLKEATNG